MNWYTVFYWISVADNVKFVTAALSVSLGIYVAIASVAALGIFDNDNFKEWSIGSRKVFYIFSIAFFINIFLWAFIPNKRDALIIVAGGTVGNFIASDSSMKQMPSEVTALLRQKIKEEMDEFKTEAIVEDLKGKTKEELIEILKNKQ